MLPGLLAFAVSVVGCRLVVTPDLVLVNGKTVKADRTAGMDLVCTDANLGAESITHAVGKTGGSVPVNAGRVYLVHETFGLGSVGGHDNIGVVRTVGVDVCDGLVNGGDGLDAEGEGEMLCVVVLGSGILNALERKRGNGGLAGLVDAEGNTLGCESGCDAGEDSV
ncbi:hypothetical protein HG530_013531 [Fusarium avenaceum]|nr:hypothetical protein HG530_013531 [Fusarium avenaceum]